MDPAPLNDRDTLAADGLTVRPDAGSRPSFFAQTPDLDRFMAMIVALAGEVAVLRARLDTHERLAGAAGTFDRAAVDAFRPDPAAALERHADRRELIQRVFQVLSTDLDALLGDVRVHESLAGDVPAAEPEEPRR